MEIISILDPLNECDLFALHLVYQPPLDMALKDLIILEQLWTTNEGALTPMQIWMQGVYCNLMNDTLRDTVDLSDFDCTNYGVHEEASIPLNDI